MAVAMRVSSKRGILLNLGLYANIPTTHVCCPIIALSAHVSDVNGAFNQFCLYCSSNINTGDGVNMLEVQKRLLDGIVVINETNTYTTLSCGL